MHVLPVDPATMAVNLALLAAIALGLGAGCFFFVRGFGLLRRKHLVLNTPRCAIRGAAIGLVEVSGRASGPYTLISPLSQVDCFYYRSTAWQADEQRRRWRKVADEKLYAPFFVEDETGNVMVDVRGAEMGLPPVFSEEVGSGEVLEYMQHFLNRHGISMDLPVKLEEVCVCPGDTLFILGTLQENPRAGSVDALRSADPEPMSAGAADLQRRGAMDALHVSEADLANRRPRTPASESFDLHPAVILGKGSSDPFLLSNRSEREIILEMAWKSTLYIWAGPILIVLCLWLLVSRMASP